ncbi:hypothetical protein P9112_007577 [Eukaryota sp. TZLM1-RC]
MTDAHTVNNIDLEFPILCSTCLGPSKHIQMVRRHAFSSCRICDRPYTSFRWQPGPKARYKHTVVCATCARGQNVCECCLLDLDLGISVAKRDSLSNSLVARSRKGKEYLATLAESKEHEMSLQNSDLGKIEPLRRSSLLKNADLKPDYTRNQAKTCTFWLKGTCNRGKECPYRHSKDEKDSTLSIEQRFYGESSSKTCTTKSTLDSIPLPHETSGEEVMYKVMDPENIGGV